MGTRKSKTEELSPTLREQLAHIRASEKSGETLKAYAKRHRVSVQALYQAKKTARQRGLLPPHRARRKAVGESKKRPMSPRFIEAVQSHRPSVPSPAWRLRLTSGEVFESNCDLDSRELARLIRALRGDS